jgi:hypothetical protein
MVKGILGAVAKAPETEFPAGESSSPASPGGEAQEALAALPAWVWVLVALGMLALLPVVCCIRAWWRNAKIDW